jgi:hypothetical protein
VQSGSSPRSNKKPAFSRASRALLMSDRSLLPTLPVAIKGSSSRTTRFALLMSLLLCTVAAVGMWQHAYGRAPDVEPTILFALLAVIAIATLRRDNAVLRLTTEGFDYSWGFRRRFIPWRLVQSFRDARGSGSRGLFTDKIIGWNYLPGIAKPKQLRMLGAGRLGFDGFLPSNYGMPANDLCELLNRIRDRYGAPTPELWGIASSDP